MATSSPAASRTTSRPSPRRSSRLCRRPVQAHEVQSVLALILVLLFLTVYWRYRSVSLGIFVLPIVFLMAVLAAFRPGQETFSQPVHTGWVLVHIVLLLAAYAALVIS